MYRRDTDTDLKETYGFITTSIYYYSEENRSYYLEPRFKMNMYQGMNYVPIRDDKW